MNLAIFGGAQRFVKPQSVGAPIVEPDTHKRFLKLQAGVFERNFYTNDGPLLRELEEAVASLHHVRHAVILSNATLAQLLLMEVLGIRSGKVLVSANTFIATAHVCEWVGATPVFADIDCGTLNLLPSEIDRLADRDVKAVVPTHVFGRFADMKEIIAKADRLGIKVVVDASHAFDCTDEEGVYAGGRDVPEFLSFHATKYFSTFEGGAVLTNDVSFVDELRSLRNFGFVGVDDVRALGLNTKMNEVSAAFGLAQIPALERRRERLCAVRDWYLEGLVGIPGLRMHELGGGRNNGRYFALFVEDGFGVSRDALCEVLWKENVLARRYFYPGCHRMAYYADQPQVRGAVLPNTDKALGTVLSLPTSFAGVGDKDGVDAIVEVVKTVHERAEKVEAWWKAWESGGGTR